MVLDRPHPRRPGGLTRSPGARCLSRRSIRQRSWCTSGAAAGTREPAGDPLGLQMSLVVFRRFELLAILIAGEQAGPCAAQLIEQGRALIAVCRRPPGGPRVGDGLRALD